MTDSRFLRILRKGKSSIPSWYDVPLNNSILVITVEGVGVVHVESGRYTFDDYVAFKDDRWPDGLIAVLRANAVRSRHVFPDRRARQVSPHDRAGQSLPCASDPWSVGERTGKC